MLRPQCVCVCDHCSVWNSKGMVFVCWMLPLYTQRWATVTKHGAFVCLYQMYIQRIKYYIYTDICIILGLLGIHISRTIVALITCARDYRIMGRRWRNTCAGLGQPSWTSPMYIYIYMCWMNSCNGLVICYVKVVEAIFIAFS